MIRAFQERFGIRIREGYGLSETSGWATSTPPDQEPKLGAVGRAVHGMRLEIRDPDGRAGARPARSARSGCTGPIVMKGYWRRPEATAEAIRDGWLRTGDLGTLDEDGDLRIVDRLKELIIRGGYNVYPREVEEVLYQHPDIVEAAVIGVADPTYGEEVAAAIVLRDGADPRRRRSCAPGPRSGSAPTRCRTSCRCCPPCPRVRPARSSSARSTATELRTSSGTGV